MGDACPVEAWNPSYDDLGLAPGRLVPDQPKSSLADTFKDARRRAFRVEARRHRYVRIDHDAFHAPSASALLLWKLPPQIARRRKRSAFPASRWRRGSRRARGCTAFTLGGEPRVRILRPPPLSLLTYLWRRARRR